MATFTVAASLSQLATAVGLSKTRTHTISREPWFPPKGPGGWVVDDCLRAIAANRRGEAPPPPASASPSPAQADRSDLAVLQAGSDPVGVARAALRVASSQLAGISSGSIDGGARAPIELLRNALEGVKRSLEELRRTEAGYLELQKERDQVVDVDVAKGVVALAGRRFVAACTRLEVAIASKVELWLADARFRGLDPQERQREARAWVVEQTTAARSLDASEVDRMVADAIKDAK